MLKFFSSIPIEENSGDFRLISRRVIDEYKKFSEIYPFFRFIVDFIGFKNSLYDEIDHQNKLISNFFAQTEALMVGKNKNRDWFECPSSKNHTVFWFCTTSLACSCRNNFEM